jgi:hypothetical protein
MFRSRKASQENSSNSMRDHGGDVVGGGKFLKLGSMFKNWKLREYVVRSNGAMTYHDPINGEHRGTINISSVRLSIGDSSNVRKSGCSSDGFCICMAVSGESKVWTLVFTDVLQANMFLDLIEENSRVSNNVQVIFDD